MARSVTVAQSHDEDRGGRSVTGAQGSLTGLQKSATGMGVWEKVGKEV